MHESWSLTYELLSRELKNFISIKKQESKRNKYCNNKLFDNNYAYKIRHKICIINIVKPILSINHDMNDMYKTTSFCVL